MVVHKVQWNKEIQVCKFRKPVADTIMNDEVITEQKYTTIKPEYDNRDKVLVGSPGD